MENSYFELKLVFQKEKVSHLKLVLLREHYFLMKKNIDIL